MSSPTYPAPFLPLARAEALLGALAKVGELLVIVLGLVELALELLVLLGRKELHELNRVPVECFVDEAKFLAAAIESRLLFAAVTARRVNMR